MVSLHSLAVTVANAIYVKLNGGPIIAFSADIRQMLLFFSDTKLHTYSGTGCPDWAIVFFGQFFFNYRSSPKFLAACFHGLGCVLILTKKWLGKILCLFFTNSSEAGSLKF
jgi:hypothetical protein